MTQKTRSKSVLFIALVFKLLMFLVTLGFLSFVFLFWRLSTKPLDLGFLMPEIQSYILPSDSQLKLKADSVLLSAKMTRSGLFHIDIKNMSLLGKNDVLILDLPHVEVSYGLSHMLTLNYMPRIVQIDDALLQLRLTKEGGLLLQDQDDPHSTQVPTRERPLEQIDDALVVKDMHLFFKYLFSFRRLVLSNASVIIDDEKFNRRIFVPSLNFQLKKRRFSQFDLKLDTLVRIQNEEMNLKGSAVVNSVARHVLFNFNFDRIDLKQISRIIPLLDGIDLTVGGELSGQMDFAARNNKLSRFFEDVSFKVKTLKTGTVRLPEPLNTSYSVAALAAEGHFTKNLETLRIQPVKAALTSGLAADVDLTIIGLGEYLDTFDFSKVKTTLNSRINDIPIEEVPSVWPSYLGPDAHAWVKQNLRDGKAPTALFSLYFTGTELTDLFGDARFEDVTVDYLSPMLPVQHASGRILFYPDKLEIFADSGSVRNLKLQAANVYLLDLRDDVAHAKIELDASGPASEMLSLVDSKPLELLKSYPINAADTRGQASAQVTLVFPLSETISPKDVQVDLKASVSQGHFQIADTPYGLDNAMLGILVNNDEMVVKGSGVYEKLPIDVQWNEYFSDQENSLKRSFKIDGKVSDLALKKWYSDISDYIIGYIKGQIIYQEKTDGATVQLSAQLDDAEIMMYPISYTKVKGVPSQLNMELFLDAQQKPNMIRFNMEADRKAFLTEGVVQRDGAKTTVTLSRLTAPGTSLSAQAYWVPEKEMFLRLKGKEWLMTELKNTPFFKKKSFDSTQVAVPTANVLVPPMNVDVDISMDTMTLNTAAPLRQVVVKAKRSGLVWDNLFVFVRGSEATSINLTPSRQQVEGLCHDVGDFLNRLNLSNGFSHGRASLDARQQKNGLITGEVTLKNLDMKDPGFITQALTILGIVDAFRGKELTFSNGSIPFSVTPRFDFDINDGAVYGTSLGVTFEGKASLDYLHLDGAVIPAYAVNSLPGKIPLIGNLFKDSEHGGLMGVNYSVTGSPFVPQVSFHPLSSIAPGILGRLFK